MATQIPVDVNRLHKWYQENIANLEKTNTEIERQEKYRSEVLSNLFLVAELFKRLHAENPKRKLPILEIPRDMQMHQTIGDEMQKILLFRGPIKRKDLIIELRKLGVKMSEKNPQQTLANAIKRDAKKRFVVLLDKRVALRDKHEKADEPR